MGEAVRKTRKGGDEMGKGKGKGKVSDLHFLFKITFKRWSC